MGGTMKEQMETVCAELGISAELPLIQQIQVAQAQLGLKKKGSIAAQVKALVTELGGSQEMDAAAADVPVVEGTLVVEEEPTISSSPPPGVAARAVGVVRALSGGRLNTTTASATSTSASSTSASSTSASSQAATAARAAPSTGNPPASTGPMPALRMTYSRTRETFGFDIFDIHGFRMTPLKLVFLQAIMTASWGGFVFQHFRYGTNDPNPLYPAPAPPPYPRFPSGHPDECVFDLVACNLHCASERTKCLELGGRNIGAICTKRTGVSWTYDAFEDAMAAAQVRNTTVTQLEILHTMPGELFTAAQVNDKVCDRPWCEVSCACGMDARRMGGDTDCTVFEAAWDAGTAILLGLSIVSSFAFMMSLIKLGERVTKMMKGARRIEHAAVRAYVERAQRSTPVIKVHAKCGHRPPKGVERITWRETRALEYEEAVDTTTLTRNWKVEGAEDTPWEETISAARPVAIASRFVWKVGDDATRRSLRSIKERLHRECAHRDKSIPSTARSTSTVTTQATLKDLIEYQVYVPPGTSLRGAPEGSGSDADDCKGECTGCLLHFLCGLLCPMYASLHFYRGTRGLNLITHTTYKSVYVRARRDVVDL